MDPYTKDQLLSRLQELQVDFACYDHPVVMTVEAQAKYVGHLEGGLSKNLFLKDKKQRYYIVSALAKTTIDLKVLSQRLGLGKGGLRMAPEEDVLKLLKVPLGCVTPFSLINESARSVSLLLDQGFKTQKCCFFHPLTNETTLSLNSCDLDKFLVSIGRSPSYVDLEANPLVGKDQPPDLAVFAPCGAPAVIEQPGKPVSTQAASVNHETGQNKPVSSAKAGANAQAVQAKRDSEKLSSSLTSQLTVSDVGKLIDELIEKTAVAVLSEVAHDSSQRDLVAPVVDAVKKRIGPNLENLTMSLKNAAYTEGFHSGAQSVIYKGLRSPSSFL